MPETSQLFMLFRIYGLLPGLMLQLYQQPQLVTQTKTITLVKEPPRHEEIIFSFSLV